MIGSNEGNDLLLNCRYNNWFNCAICRGELHRNFAYIFADSAGYSAYIQDSPLLEGED